MKYFCLAVALIINLAIFPVLVFAGHPPAVGGPVLVLASPFGVGAIDVVVGANGAFIGANQSALGSLSYSADPHYIDILQNAGAWMVLDGRLLAQLCGV